MVHPPTRSLARLAWHRLRAGLVGALIAVAAAGVAQSATPGPRGDAEPHFAALVSREESIVVSVRALGLDGEYGGFNENGWKDVPPPDPLSGDGGSGALPTDPSLSLASGFVIDADGWVLTNAHAVVGAKRLRVRLADGGEAAARIAGYDLRTDLALLRLERHGLPVARIGDPKKVAVGDWVFTIGAPFGLELSVTAGIVSAYPRFLPGGGGVPMLQTDAAINPGSSGSPLFNLKGEVIGINSMMLSGSGGYEGVSLALPIDVAMRVVADLRSRGYVQRSHLGAQVQEVTPELARSFGLDAPMGALVLSVAQGGPAEQAGLRTGDIVLGVEGAPDRRYVTLQQAVASAAPGEPMQLEVWRRNAKLTVTLHPAAIEPDASAASPPATSPDPRLGLVVEELTPARRSVLRLAGGGVGVRSTRGPAWYAGLRSGDAILAVNDVTVADVAAFDAALAAARASGRPVAFLIQRGSVIGYLAVDADD